MIHYPDTAENLVSNKGTQFIIGLRTVSASCTYDYDILVPDPGAIQSLQKDTQYHARILPASRFVADNYADFVAGFHHIFDPPCPDGIVQRILNKFTRRA